MSLNFYSLSGAPVSDSEGLDEIQWISVRTGPGDEDFIRVLLGDFRTYMTEVVNARIDNIDTGGGGSGPSIWPVARTMTLSGPVGGSASFDGSSNFTVLTSIADGALSIAKVSGLQTALDAKLNTSAYTAADVLAKLLTVDGSGSGLDADLLDGYSSRDFLNNTNLTGNTNLNAFSMARTAFNTSGLTNAPGGSTNFFNYLMSSHQGGNYVSTALAMGHDGSLHHGFATGTAAAYLDRTWTWNRIWTEATFDPTTKANVSGQVFTGTVRAPTLHVQAAAGANAEVVLRDETGLSQGIVYWNRGDDRVNVRRMNAAGNGAEGELSVGATNVTFNGNELYHTGNLNAGTLGYLAVAATVYGSGTGVNCNDFTAGSKSLVHQSNANTPGSSSTFWYIETLQTGTSTANLLQRAWSPTVDEQYFRRAVSGAWGAWRRVWNSSNFDPSTKLDSNANAATATRLQNARTITLTGVATGSGSFDGSADMSIATSVADGALSIAKTSGLQTALDGKLSTGAFGLGGMLTGFDWNDTERVTRFAAGSVNTPLAGSNVMGFRAALNNAQTIAFTLAGRSNRAWIQSIEANTVNPWYEIWTTNNLPNPVSTSRQILSGNGLTGGGSLATDQTISLGLPGTITGSSSNAVSTSSHTHALSAGLSAWEAITPASKADADSVWTSPNGVLRNDVTDFSVVDNTIRTGAYQYNSSTSVGGFLQNWGTIYHTRRAGGGGETQMQITETGRLAIRGRTTGSWTSWNELVPYSVVSTSAGNNTIAQRTSTGDLAVRLLRSEYTTLTPSANYVMGQVEIGAGVDNYVRPMTMAVLWSKLAPSAVAGTDVASYAPTLTRKSDNIGSGVDLNTMTTMGIWHQPANAGATSGTNYPSSFAGMLTVTTNSDSTYIYQSYQNYNSAITYVRSYYNGTWYPWRQLLDGTGGITVGGSVTSTQNFISSGSNVILAGGGGAVYLRPNGAASATGQLSISSVGNVTMGGTFTIENAAEARIDLNATGTNGRNIRLVSNTTPNTGFYDVTNNAWLMRIDGGNMMYTAGALSVGASMSASGTITATQSIQTNLGRLYGSASELNLMGNSATAVVRIRPQGWATAGQTIFNANGTIETSNHIYNAGEYIANTANGLRIASGSIGCILRNDGSNFYMLFTASGDPNGSWNTLRPITVSNTTGLVSIGHGMGLSGNLSVSGNITAPFVQMGSGAAGIVARVGNDCDLWDRDVANALGIRGVQNANVGYILFGNDNNALGYNGTTLHYGGSSSVSGSHTVGGSVDFGSSTRQMLNLFGTTYGIGIQSSTMYFRTGSTAITTGGFAWHRGGVHSATAMDPGSGGTLIGKLDGTGVWSGNDFTIFSDRRIKSKIRPFEYRGRLSPKMYTHNLTGFEDFGFIAQDIQKLYPEAVSKSEETPHLRLSMPKLVAVVSHQVNAVEDQQVKQDKRIAKLELSNKTLKQDNMQLSKRLRRVEAQVAKLLARAA